MDYLVLPGLVLLLLALLHATDPAEFNIYVSLYHWVGKRLRAPRQERSLTAITDEDLDTMLRELWTLIQDHRHDCRCRDCLEYEILFFQ